MKKFFVSTMAFLYLSTSMGATIHMHYCMGKLISWGLINHASSRCATCGMQKDTGTHGGKSFGNHCCKDEHKEIKTDKDQKSAQTVFQFFKLSSEASNPQSLSLSSFTVSSFIVK